MGVVRACAGHAAGELKALAFSTELLVQGTHHEGLSALVTDATSTSSEGGAPHPTTPSTAARAAPRRTVAASSPQCSSPHSNLARDATSPFRNHVRSSRSPPALSAASSARTSLHHTRTLGDLLGQAILLCRLFRVVCFASSVSRRLFRVVCFALTVVLKSIGVSRRGVLRCTVGDRPGRLAADPRPVPAQSVRDVRRSLTPGARKAFDLLLRAQRFESASVNEGGELSTPARAVRRLVRDRRAMEAFRALFDRGTTVSRLYALTAFWYLRPQEFASLVKVVQARDGNQVVLTQAGCIEEEASVTELLDSRSNAVRLPPGTGLYAFMCRQNVETTFYSDIAGGAVPIEIVEGESIRPDLCAHSPPLPQYLRPRPREGR